LEQLGIHPLHFGIIMIMKLSSVCDSAVGTCSFRGAALPNTRDLSDRHIVPLYIAMVAALLLTIYVPAISMWLPEKLGLLR
jgi:TRAP-type C4-dicarboxylate transport system permease large subunit